MALDETGLDKQLEMTRDARLRLAKDDDELADRQLGDAEEREEAQASRFARRGESEKNVVEGRMSFRRINHDARYKDIFISVKTNVARSATVCDNPSSCLTFRPPVSWSPTSF